MKKGLVTYKSEPSFYIHLHAFCMQTVKAMTSPDIENHHCLKYAINRGYSNVLLKTSFFTSEVEYIFKNNHLNFLFNIYKGVRALRGYFGPLLSQKLKIAFHQFLLIGLLEKYLKCNILAFILLLQLLW